MTIGGVAHKVEVLRNKCDGVGDGAKRRPGVDGAQCS
jgi:hypothetical protein